MIKTPPVTKGVLDGVKVLLQNANVLDYSGYGGIILAEGDQLDLEKDDPLEHPPPAADGFWWRIILMDVINGIQEPIQYTDNMRNYRFYLRVDVQPPSGDFDAQYFLEKVHNLCYEALDYKTTTFEGARQEFSIKRQTFPTPMFRDDTKGFRYMSAEYYTGIGPEQ